MHMIQRLTYTRPYVLDQDAARDFYVDKLGFEVRTDARMDNGFRWLTVGPKGQRELQIILMKIDGPNLDKDTAASLRRLLEQGILCGGVLETSDCRQDYEDLKAKGGRVQLTAGGALLRHRSRDERQLGELVQPHGAQGQLTR
jgi:catechol 2,3-dioxygenase-like lactoylglutathione lyase family enzyme